MNNFRSFKGKLYEVNDSSFDDIALEVFKFQSANNPVYADYLRHLAVNPQTITSVADIPFLPIAFFKSHAVKSGAWKEEDTFISSGTSGSAPSRHLIHDLQFYNEHAKRCFEDVFGPLVDYHFLALLPSYLERSGSSLISMMAYFIQESGSAESGFFLREYDLLLKKLQLLKKSNRRTIIWGVSFALLEFAERHQEDLSHCLIFETGGMKGRRRELTRNELHIILRERFNAHQVFSEYGMTELMSQAYSDGSVRFQPSFAMKVIGRDLTDPFATGLTEESAGINVIDLANFHSISFIETQDLGKIYQNGTFEILGRIDNSDVRGCNLMI